MSRTKTVTTAKGVETSYHGGRFYEVDAALGQEMIDSEYAELAAADNTVATDPPDKDTAEPPQPEPVTEPPAHGPFDDPEE
jgi:hypothetical protein